MKLHFVGVLWLLAIGPYLVPLSAQTAGCLDAADESHHQLFYENEDARVLLLELPRIASTQPHCHAHPYLYIVTGESKSSTTPEGKATFSHDWNGPEARFVYRPVKQVIRNESMIAFREVIVETLHSVHYDPLEVSYDTDLFPGDLGSAKPTWTVSFTRGDLTAFKTQLAPGDNATFGSPNHVLIAVTDVKLQRTSAETAPQELELNAQEVHMLSGGSQFKLTNAGSHSATFILIEF
ncbi:MAG: hypothetical protein JWN74_2272 [Acidobacteriaceae bacterium]|nr:hypothetical protein [Acidobacteriaceae bacterium]